MPEVWGESVIPKKERTFKDPSDSCPLSCFNLNWIVISVGLALFLSAMILLTNSSDITMEKVITKVLLSVLLGVLSSPLIEWCCKTFKLF